MIRLVLKNYWHFRAYIEETGNSEFGILVLLFRNLNNFTVQNML